MWHETKEELMEFLKSILRLDEDQCARRMAMKYVQLNKDDIDKEYYDLESKYLKSISKGSFTKRSLFVWLIILFF